MTWLQRHLEHNRLWSASEDKSRLIRCTQGTLDDTRRCACHNERHYTQPFLVPYLSSTPPNVMPFLHTGHTNDGSFPNERLEDGCALTFIVAQSVEDARACKSIQSTEKVWSRLEKWPWRQRARRSFLSNCLTQIKKCIVDRWKKVGHLYGCCWPSSSMRCALLLFCSNQDFKCVFC